jgi:hypothetical protein
MHQSILKQTGFRQRCGHLLPEAGRPQAAGKMLTARGGDTSDACSRSGKARMRLGDFFFFRDFGIGVRERLFLRRFARLAEGRPLR